MDYHVLQRLGREQVALGAVLTAALNVRKGRFGNVTQELAAQVAEVIQSGMEEEFDRRGATMPPGTDSAFYEASKLSQLWLETTYWKLERLAVRLKLRLQ